MPTQKVNRSNVPIYFGKVAADSLLQYDPKEWCYLKKKVIDVFYDYEQHKLGSNFIYPNNPPI